MYHSLGILYFLRVYYITMSCIDTAYKLYTYSIVFITRQRHPKKENLFLIKGLLIRLQIFSKPQIFNIPVCWIKRHLYRWCNDAPPCTTCPTSSNPIQDLYKYENGFLTHWKTFSSQKAIKNVKSFLNSFLEVTFFGLFYTDRLWRLFKQIYIARELTYAYKATLNNVKNDI
jgi:hypothetical protein